MCAEGCKSEALFPTISEFLKFYKINKTTNDEHRKKNITFEVKHVVVYKFNNDLDRSSLLLS